MLLTASCSFHLSKALFLEMLEEPPADSGRRIAIGKYSGSR
jgi:23S rRNA (cytosine1962-C5)-methyltransferase